MGDINRSKTITAIYKRILNNMRTLFDPDDAGDIAAGDAVICYNQNGRTMPGTAAEINCMDDAGLTALCDGIGYHELPIAKRDTGE